MRSRSRSVPLDWLYPSRISRSGTADAPARPSSSWIVSGWTPDSERLKRTRFSQVLCQRSSSKGTKRIPVIGSRLPVVRVPQVGEIRGVLQPEIRLQVLQIRPPERSPQHGGGPDARGTPAFQVMPRIADEHRPLRGRAESIQ